MIHDPCALLDRLLREPAKTHGSSSRSTMLTVERSASMSAPSLTRHARGARSSVSRLWRRRQDEAACGYEVRLTELKQGGENLANWLSRLLEPRLRPRHGRTSSAKAFPSRSSARSGLRAACPLQRNRVHPHRPENKRRLADFPSMSGRSGSASADAASKAPWPKPTSRRIRSSLSSIPIPCSTLPGEPKT